MSLKTLTPELTGPWLEDDAEDLLFARVLHLGERQEVEVPQQPGRDGVAAPTWRSHRAHEVHVHQVAELADGLAVVPAVEVHPLPQQLDGRLGPVHLESGHVEVVNEENEVFTQWRAEHAFTSVRKQSISFSTSTALDMQ